MRLSQLQTIDNNVNQIVAGDNISLSPANGIGTVVVSSLGSGGGTPNSAFPPGMSVSLITRTITNIAQQEIDSILLTTSNAIRYEFEMSNGIDFHTATFSIVHDNVNVVSVEYGSIFTNGSLGTLNAVISGGNLILLLTPATAYMQIKLIRTIIATNSYIAPPPIAATIPAISHNTFTIPASVGYIMDSTPYVDARSIRYNIQIRSMLDFHVTELFIMHDDITSFSSEYGTISTAGGLATFNARLLNNNLEVLVTTSSSVEITFVKTIVGTNGSLLVNTNEAVFISSALLPNISDQVVDQFPITTSNTIKYDLQLSSNGNYHTTQLLMIQDGIGVYSTEYATVYNTSLLALFGVNVIGGDIKLSVSPLVANLKVDLIRTMIIPITPTSEYVSLVYISTSTIEQILDSIDISLGNSFKYNIQIASGSTYQMVELVVTHDGTNTYAVEYGELQNSTILASFSSRVINNNFELLFTPTIANVEIAALRLMIA